MRTVGILQAILLILTLLHSAASAAGSGKILLSLEAKDLKGGHPRYEVYEGCPSALIYGAKSGFSELRADFDLDDLGLSESPHACLTIKGMDDEEVGRKAQIIININDKTIFRGVNEFPDDKWKVLSYPIEKGVLKNGLNTITIRQVDDTTNSFTTPWFMVSWVRIEERKVSGKQGLMSPSKVLRVSEGPTEDRPLIIPAPKKAVWQPGTYTLSQMSRIITAESASAEVVTAVEFLREELAALGLHSLPRVTSKAVKNPNVIVISRAEEKLSSRYQTTPLKNVKGEEGYALHISPKSVSIVGNDARGTFCGVKTLLQIIPGSRSDYKLPCVKIEDWPDVKTRAFVLNIAGWGNESVRPDLPFLRKLVRLIALCKYNMLLLQQIGGIQLKSQPSTYFEGSITKDETIELVNYAKKLGLEVVPVFNSLAHTHEWMGAERLKQFPDLADIFEDANGDTFRINSPRTYNYLFSIYDELLDIFHPKYFLVGLDEVSKLGLRQEDSEWPKPQLFAEHVRRLHDYFQPKGIRMIMWSDMFLDSTKWSSLDKNAPCDGGPPLNIYKSLSMLPKDIVICYWHYGTSPSDFAPMDYFQSCGFETWGMPAFIEVNISSFAKKAKRIDAGICAIAWQSLLPLPDASHGWMFRPHGENADAILLNAEYCWTAERQKPLGYSPLIEMARAVFKRGTAEKQAEGDYATIDLSANCNLGFGGKDWSLFDPERTMETIPMGRVSSSGVPFHIIDSKQDIRNSCVMVSASDSKTSSISIGSKASKVIFMHTLAPEYGQVVWQGTNVGKHTVEYEDGSKAEIQLVHGKNIDKWLPTSFLYDTSPYNVWLAYGERDQFLTANRFLGNGIALYALEWQNPYPEKKIASVTVSASVEKVSLILLAVTIEKNKR